MMRVAEQRILLVDHSKFGKSALNLFADLADFDRVFVGDRLARTDRDVLEAAGVRLEVVPL